MITNKQLQLDIIEAREDVRQRVRGTYFEEMKEEDILETDNEDFNVGYDMGWIKALEYIGSGNN